MPIKKTKGGYKWGSKGHTYPTREGAAKQAAAAHANGYRGDTMYYDSAKATHDHIMGSSTPAKGPYTGQDSPVYSSEEDGTNYKTP